MALEDITVLLSQRNLTFTPIPHFLPLHYTTKPHSSTHIHTHTYAHYAIRTHTCMYCTNTSTTHSTVLTSSLFAGRGGGARTTGRGGGGKSGLLVLPTEGGAGLKERFSLGGTGRGVEGLGTTYFLAVKPAEGVGELRGELRGERSSVDLVCGALKRHSKCVHIRR